jgi:hypothetical protein
MGLPTPRYQNATSLRCNCPAELLTLCLTRSSSSDSSLVGSATAAAFSAGACADSTAAAAVDLQCRTAGLRPHCILLTQLPLLLLLRALHLLLGASVCRAGCVSSGATAQDLPAAPDHAVRLLANGRYRWSSHLGASLLQAMSWLCCATFMLCLSP